MSNRTIVVGNLVLSVVIYAFLMWLIYAFELKAYEGDDFRWLPHFNAACNAISATAITIGVIFIRRHNKRAHATAMIVATCSSALFLIGYLTHHAINEDTKFMGVGAIRHVYFAILISHVILAGVALPLILNTLSFAALRRFDSHRAIARWTYPIWLYVSITGVIVWAFLRLW